MPQRGNPADEQLIRNLLQNNSQTRQNIRDTRGFYWSPHLLSLEESIVAGNINTFIHLDERGHGALWWPKTPLIDMALTLQMAQVVAARGWTCTDDVNLVRSALGLITVPVAEHELKDMEPLDAAIFRGDIQAIDSGLLLTPMDPTQQHWSSPLVRDFFLLRLIPIHRQKLYLVLPPGLRGDERDIVAAYRECWDDVEELLVIRSPRHVSRKQGFPTMPTFCGIS